MNNSSLHHAIISSFLEHQRAPTVHELADRFERDESEVRQGLRTLAEGHGVVLHPKSDEVWIAHPFSAAPTTYVVKSGSRKWWGNCAWCSLGVARLAGGSATVETRLGAIDDPAIIKIENGKLLDSNYVIHFPVSMKNAWDNVVYTCSVQLLFRNEAQVEKWCTERGIPMGDVRPLEQIWAFSTEWYGRHGDADWTKWTIQEAIEIFARHHLDGPVWTLTQAAERF